MTFSSTKPREPKSSARIPSRSSSRCSSARAGSCSWSRPAQPVDELIAEILPLLEKGDIIIDGGNSLYQDTIRRTKELEAKGFWFIGTGVSGGEEGARRGPSIMPGGSKAAWPHVKDIFQAIAAKVEGDVPCCDWVGRTARGITSRWCITVSNTATCSWWPRPTS